MGKILVIKGADFSVNAVDSYTPPTEVCLYDDEVQIPENRYNAVSLVPNQTEGSEQGYDYWDLAINGDRSIAGCVLTKIKMNLYNTGQFSLVYWNSRPTAMGQSTIIQTWTITQTGIQDLVLDTPFEVQSGMYIGVGAPTDRVRFRYNNNANHPEGLGFYFNATKVAKNSSTNQPAGSLGVSYYGYQ